MAVINWKDKATIDAEAKAAEDARQAEEQASAELATAIEAATSLEDLKAALLGTSPGSRARVAASRAGGPNGA